MSTKSFSMCELCKIKSERHRLTHSVPSENGIKTSQNYKCDQGAVLSLNQRGTRHFPGQLWTVIKEKATCSML